MELVQRTASLPRGSGLWNSCHAVPRYLGAVGNATRAMHCLTTCGRWVVELVICTATFFGGGGLWSSCNALPHCLGAVGNGTASFGQLMWFKACAQIFAEGRLNCLDTSNLVHAHSILPEYWRRSRKGCQFSYLCVVL